MSKERQSPFVLLAEVLTICRYREFCRKLFAHVQTPFAHHCTSQQFHHYRENFYFDSINRQMTKHHTTFPNTNPVDLRELKISRHNEILTPNHSFYFRPRCAIFSNVEPPARTKKATNLLFASGCNKKERFA